MLGTTVAATAAALLSALPAVHAGSRAIIQNYCGFDVYSWSVDTDNNPQEPTVIKGNGGVYNEDCRVLDVGGVSIKLALDNQLDSPQTQLEYTINYDVWYDVSNVNCQGHDCPFQPYGLYLHSGHDCPTVSCIPGNETCHGAYTLWDDNWASLNCQQPDANIYLYLCTDSADPPEDGPPPPTHHRHHKKPALPASSSIFSSTFSSSSAAPEVAGAATETPKEPKVKPTSTVDPATEYVDVTQVMTKVVTVTPTHTATKIVHARHIHDHMHAHHH